MSATLIAPAGTDRSPARFLDPAIDRQRSALVRPARTATAPRRIDPTTCERDYSADEMELMRAMQEYRQVSGRMFPTWSEVLEVLRDLGYSKSA